MHAAQCGVLLQATKRERWVSGNFSFFRMHRISDIYFVGGFGTVQWVDVAEYASVKPDQIALVEPHHTLKACPHLDQPFWCVCWSSLSGMAAMAIASARYVQVLNERFSEALRHKLSRPQLAADDAAFISIDRLGTDVRVRHGNEYSVERLSFETVCAASALGSLHAGLQLCTELCGSLSMYIRWRRRSLQRTACCKATACGYASDNYMHVPAGRNAC